VRILIYSQYFWPENFGINQLANDLSDDGHIIEILTGMPNYPIGSFFKNYGGIRVKKEQWKNISIFRIPIIPRGANKGFNLFLNYLSFIVSGSILSPILLNNRKYDLIFVYGVSPILQALPAILLGKLKRIPVVLWVQDLWPESVSANGHLKSPMLLKILDCVVSFIYTHCDLILGQSNSFVKHIGKLTKRKVVFFPNSVDKFFYDSKNTKKLAHDNIFYNKFSILYAGNVGSAQGIDVFIDAAKKLRKNSAIRFIIIGTGSRIDWVKQQKKEFNLNNLILGGVHPIEEMPDILKKASVLYLTLKKEKIFEMTIPNKLQAYLAVGRPILASVDGEAAKIINTSGAGVAVEAENLNLLVNTILDLYKMPKNRLAQLGKNGKKYFKSHFDNRLLIKRLNSILEELIKK
jgi:glycosyltransferase involved in cell wall biosynthesis